MSGPGPCPTCPHGKGFNCPICWPQQTKPPNRVDQQVEQINNPVEIAIENLLYAISCATPEQIRDAMATFAARSIDQNVPHWRRELGSDLAWAIRTHMRNNFISPTGQSK